MLILQRTSHILLQSSLELALLNRFDTTCWIHPGGISSPRRRDCLTGSTVTTVRSSCFVTLFTANDVMGSKRISVINTNELAEVIGIWVYRFYLAPLGISRSQRCCNPTYPGSRTESHQPSWFSCP